MAVDKPIGDNASQGRGQEALATQDEDGGQVTVDEAGQDQRRVHGHEEEQEEVQGREAGEDVSYRLDPRYAGRLLSAR